MNINHPHAAGLHSLQPTDIKQTLIDSELEVIILLARWR